MGKGINPRSRWEIILDILEVIAKEGNRAKKTRIMRKAYLDWRNFHRHFNFLREMGFVEEIDDVSGGALYELTERGKDLRGKLKDIGVILQ